MRTYQAIAIFVCFWLALSNYATPVNKAGLQRHYGEYLGKDLDRCTTCHLPSANKAPESLDEFPHNEFGKRLRFLGIVSTSYIAKVVVAIGVTPLIYAGHALVERGLGIVPVLPDQLE